MYQGNNPIAKRSQEWLADALFELLQEKEYGKISIKEICDKADLTRQTFYQMFDDKEEVARYCILHRRNLALQPEDAQIHCPQDIKELSLQFARSIRFNMDLVKLYQQQKLEYLLLEEISGTLSNMAKRGNSQINNRLLPLANAFFAGALAKSLLVLVDETNISDEEFADFIDNLLKGGYYNFV